MKVSSGYVYLGVESATVQHNCRDYVVFEDAEAARAWVARRRRVRSYLMVPLSPNTTQVRDVIAKRLRDNRSQVTEATS